MKHLITALLLVLSTAGFSQQLTPFKDKNGKYGFVDSNGKTRIKATWDEAAAGFADLYPVKQTGLWGYIDAKGKIVVPFQYEAANARNVMKNGFWAMINKQGTPITRFKYKTLKATGDTYQACSVNQKSWGFVDTSGIEMVPMVYDEVSLYDTNFSIRKSATGYDYVKPTLLAAVKFRGLTGFIDRENNFVVPPVYKAVKGFRNGFAWVSKDSVLYGALDQGNRVVLPFRFTDPSEFNNDGMAEATLKGVKGMAYAPTHSFGVGDKKVTYNSLLKSEALTTRDFIDYGYDALYTENTKGAVKWFEKAVEAGDGEGAWNLYLLYSDSRDSINHDDKKAIEWLKKGAASKNIQSKMELGRNYLGGSLVEKNGPEALRLLKEASELALTSGAIDSLGDDDYEFVVNGIMTLGDLYHEGELTPKNDKLAFDTWLSAADLECYPAMVRVAECYLFGEGVAKDPKTAFSWYKLAADLEPDAMLALGLLYREGLGTEKNEKEAIKWLEKAAAFGNKKAKEALKASPVN